VITYNPEDAVTTWPDGEYGATIESVVPKISKAGIEKGLATPNMHEIILKVYPTGEGPTQKVWDYISYPKGTWKLEQIAEALGGLDNFKAGRFNVEEHVGQNVTVYLRTKNDSFGAKNTVGEYLPGTVVPTRAGPTAPTTLDSDIPF